MIFNGIEKDYLTVTRGRRRPSWAPIHRDLINVTGMAGSYLSETITRARPIDVPVFLLAESFSDLQKVKEDLAEWLIHDEPKELIFKDEPDRTYYAVVDSELFLGELVRWGEGVITFICPDPYKYGPEQPYEFTADTAIIENKGTAEADPIFTMNVLDPTTFAMVSNGDDYMMIGRPVDVEDIAVNRLETILNDNCSSLVGWTALPNGTSLDTGIVGGEMEVQGGYAFSAKTYGTNQNGWVGPAIKRSLSEPVQDFQCEIRIGAFNTHGDVGSLELHLLDENDNVIAVLAMRDGTSKFAENRAVIQLGQSGNRHSFLNYNGGYRSTWNDFSGIIRLEREGTEFRGYVAMLNDDGMHVRRHTVQPFHDRLGDYQGKIAQVLVYDAKAKEYTPYDKLMNNIYIGKINQEVGIPYIADEGDQIIFDHKTGDAYVNGEPVPFDFGADFFKLTEGQNALAVLPEETFETSVKFRYKFR